MKVSEVVTFYLSDYDNSYELLKAAIESLLVIYYNGYRVYLHNISNFDGIIMLKVLANMDNLKYNIIKRNGKLIDIKVKYNIDKNRIYTILFRDSLLMLPSSLNKLCKAFDVETKKGLFPYFFVNDSQINLDHIGQVPTIDKFNNITIEEYENYASNYNKWSLKNETLSYCASDVKSLWQIIRKFQISKFKRFRVYVNNYATLSSLAFAIYRVNYLKKGTIPCISGAIYRDI